MKEKIRIIGIKGFFVSLIIDLIGILFSFLIESSLTNVLLLRIILFCYCVRYELYAILVLLIICFIGYILIRKYTGRKKIVAIFFFFTPIIIVFLFSFVSLRQFIIARYYYYDRNFYIEESQHLILDKAAKYLEKCDWVNSIKYFHLAKDVYPKAYNVNDIDEAIEKCELCIKYCDQLYDSYIKPDKSHISRNKYECAKVLYQIDPVKYSHLYNSLDDSLKEAIKHYPSLYESLELNNYEECRSLILKYGWCWFEPVLYEMFSEDKEKYIMKKLNEYLSSENVYVGQYRIIKAWVDNDSISNYIN